MTSYKCTSSDKLRKEVVNSNYTRQTFYKNSTNGSKWKQALPSVSFLFALFHLLSSQDVHFYFLLKTDKGKLFYSVHYLCNIISCNSTTSICLASPADLIREISTYFWYKNTNFSCFVLLNWKVFFVKVFFCILLLYNLIRFSVKTAKFEWQAHLNLVLCELHSAENTNTR